MYIYTECPIIDLMLFMQVQLTLTVFLLKFYVARDFLGNVCLRNC